MTMMTGPENIFMPFGKHKGKRLGDIVADDPAYLDWIADKCTSPALSAAVREVCEMYAPEIEQAVNDREWRRG